MTPYASVYMPLISVEYLVMYCCAHLWSHGNVQNDDDDDGSNNKNNNGYLERLTRTGP